MELLKHFGLEPRNNELYEEAFCHSSYTNEQNLAKSYERLEFLGDKVLDLVISEYLYLKTDIDEGEMTKKRAAFVCEDALAEYALNLGLNNYIKVGRGEEQNDGKMKPAILADCFEAFIGALYLDLGLNAVKRFVNETVVVYLKNDEEGFLQDYKSTLQESVQIDKKSVIYETIKVEGPPHDRLFTIVVKVENMIWGRGQASSKKKAEQMAAKDALDKEAK